MIDLNEEIIKKIESTREIHEFLTFLIMKDEIIIGIVQNETQKLIMIYNIEKIKLENIEEEFLKYGDDWWWGSSRLIPIDAYIGKSFDKFKPFLLGYPKKAIEQIIGPTFNMSEQYLKRIKKRKIEIL